MTLASEGHASRGGLRFGGALLALSLAAAACGSSAGSPATSVDPTRSADVASPTAGTAAQGPAGTTSPAPAAGLLATALEPLRGASAFETSVTVDDAVVVSATGRSVGPASKATVTTANRTVDYIRVPPRAWAREQGGSWVLVDAATAPAGPIDALSRPATLLLVASDAGTTTFTATYPAAALGLAGDPLTVTITADAKGVTFRYAATTAGHSTVSRTTLRPSAADPIVPPAG